MRANLTQSVQHEIVKVMQLERPDRIGNERSSSNSHSRASQAWQIGTTNIHPTAPRGVQHAIDGPATHVVQFYEADAFLLDALKDFFTTTLCAGDAAVVIATPEHRAGLEQRLLADGHDVDSARAAGRYIALDAADSLARFTIDGIVNAERFREVVGAIIAQAGAGGRGVRAFGEMVALLAAGRHHAAALHVEQLWNDLQQSHTFTLFCAYPLDCLSGEELADALGDICAAHAHVIPTESYMALHTEDDRLRAVAMLQQQAHSLEAALAAEWAARMAAEEALRVRDEFLSIAAHELRTPITSLSGQAQLLRRRLQRTGSLEPAQAEAALQTITNQAERLSRLISQLLDLSRLEAGRMELYRHATDLTGLVDQAVASTAAWSEQHTITVTAPPVLEAWVDPLRLEQVLINLLNNAVKYSPEGSVIEVELARIGADTVEISVRDHGLGIPIEKRTQLFKRFYQAHSSDHRSGLGLGLYVSRQIVEAHEGEILAEFPADAGTRFVVRLPIRQCALEPPAAPTMQARA